MYYQINRETQKLQLIFDKAEYMALPDEKKREIKSNFLFSRTVGGWVSRAKWPNTYYAERTAQSIGAENRGKTGEALSFAEQMEAKAERAEARAERYEARADRAEAAGKALQKPIEDMHGDIAFFTQPIVNTSAGRAFGRRRDRMFAAWERGFEEFKKSDYYREAAQTARETAAGTKPSDKGFCQRRMDDAQKTIRAQQKNLESYRKKLDRIEAGEDLKTWSGEPVSAETVIGWIETAEELIEAAISKYAYYAECMEDLGGIQYNRENIKPGYLVKIKRFNQIVEVLSTGPKNFKYKSEFGGGWPESYAEILEIISTDGAEKPAPVHPFLIGEKWPAPVWNSAATRYETHEQEIIKRTDKTVTIRDNVTGETVRRTPQLRESKTGSAWAVWANDHYKSGFFKAVTEG